MGRDDDIDIQAREAEVTEIMAREAEAGEDFEPPPYGVPGRLMFEILSIDESDPRWCRYEVDVHYIDDDTSVFWLMEGGFPDQWICENVDLELVGFYVLEGLVGTYYRGDGYATDDAEEWDFDYCRRATDAEIESGNLS